MGCPKAKEDYEAVLPQWKKWQTMDHERDFYKDSLWRASTHFGWTYRHREAMEIYIKKSTRAKTTKTCNFCGETGHNKRTCSALKQFKSDMKAAEVSYRKAMVKAIKSTGQGIGCTVGGQRDRWCNTNKQWRSQQAVGMVQAIAWDRISLFSTGRNGKLHIGSMSSENYWLVRYTDGEIISTQSQIDYSVENEKILWQGWQQKDTSIICRSEKVNPPEEWLNGTLGYEQGILKGNKAQSMSDLSAFYRTIDFWKDREV